MGNFKQRMMRFGVPLLVLATLLMSGIVHGNSQDDNLADMKRQDTGPDLPTIDNIVQASQDNIDLILGKQLKENIVSEKKHRPLLLCLVQRQSDGNLEFQRELVKLAAVTHRQFEIALADCQFERKVCDIFSKDGRMELPALFLFKEDQIWQYSGQRQEFTKEKFLDYLSGDNWKSESIVFQTAMQDWLKTQLGITSTNQWIKKYSDWFEQKVQEYSKNIFAKLNLHHWSPNSKMILSLFMIIGPICFVIVAIFAHLIIFSYNRVAKVFYDRKIRNLKAREQDLVDQLSQLTGKKVN